MTCSLKIETIKSDENITFDCNKDVQYYAVQNYQGIRLIQTKQSNDGNSPHHHIKPGAQKVMHL